MSVYSPHINSPTAGSSCNNGTVAIQWDRDLEAASTVSYEIEYTLDYHGDDTQWNTVKRRIAYDQTSYDWIVGKMIKSSTVRLRIRARDTSTEESSDWSLGEEFSINVFELIPPAIVSPLPEILYTDFIQVILDESLTRDTYHQKVKYTLEYSSRKREVDWTTIQTNVPAGQNVIRWDISDLLPSDDYVLKLTARNSSTCYEATEEQPDQIATRFVHNIHIQQSGMFIIDTKPPQAVLRIESESGVTNQIEQTVTIFAEDATTDVKQIQMRECNGGSELTLGDLEDPTGPAGACATIEELLDGDPDLDNLIGKPFGNNSKVQWLFEDRSGLRKIEALLTDSGGNSSLQETTKVFLNTYSASSTITDFIITVEQKDKILIDRNTSPPSVVVDPSIYEVVYFSTLSGEFWTLEPYAKLLYSFAGHQIYKIVEFAGSIYIFTWNPTTDEGAMFRHDGDEPTAIAFFPVSRSITTATATFNDNLYFGWENGVIICFSGLSFSFVAEVVDPVASMFADDKYLYVGFQNSTLLFLYNGTDYVTLDVST